MLSSGGLGALALRADLVAQLSQPAYFLDGGRELFEVRGPLPVIDQRARCLGGGISHRQVLCWGIEAV